ncbi:MAG: DUF1684 domain-containing protein [Anaerolineales bacterium]|nr:MAG: DUF1684 domain-containing protein [Chloroflexota bacterium]MBE7435965.1 DUF1684 domain-containing protein [Anaerolineales bacterium]MCE7859634.1 DUF1684 domain-containing protein [Chloroflexi bacterium CFX2]MCK6582843.1 DUF1684 domain-containing protein [Anaerolineales bacterium]
MTELEAFRAEKDEFFASHPQSPLTREQKAGFHGLNYFPENEQLRIEAQVEEFSVKDGFDMQTSTGGVQHYERYGRISFSVEGETVELTIFRSEHGYFLPFVDSLAGRETYPAGRYLEPEVLPGGRFLVDFNLAYNPYCAYNEMWSCPITPVENRVRVPIRAGEKLFHG